MENNKQKVLIIDDDRFLLNMYSLKFQKSGFEVDTTESGEDALTKLRGGVLPDVLLVDVAMPAMDGIDFLKNMRKENLVPNATIIVLSNQNQPNDIERAKDLGIASYLVKASYIPSEVVAEVVKIVNQRKG
ncbi:MAG: response regulator [Candidatus Taylorbacteria bacterium]|nr:response regulator [Candidatus Taylorbacteria bacterium]